MTALCVEQMSLLNIADEQKREKIFLESYASIRVAMDEHNAIRYRQK